MFVNTLVLRTRVDPGLSFSDLVDRTRVADLGAFSHAEVPFERVVEAVGPVRSTAHSPLFQVVLEFQNVERPHLELPGLVVETVELDVGVSNFDLQLTLCERYDEDGAPVGIDARFTYAADLFDLATVRSFADRLVRILDAVTADPSSAISAIEIRESPPLDKDRT
ncbi:MAG: condensation domain-containing protein, partial [Pseudonocardia sp.]